MKWKTGTGGHGYRYGYDRRNRLVVASHCLYDMSLSHDDYSEAMTYNRNSAITSLIRTGNSLAGHGNMDVLSYSYNGNRLTSITDMGSSNIYDGAFEFVNGSNTNQEYTYNTAGDLTRDRNKGIARIDYDLFGHPRRIQFRNGNVTQYVYTADGRKLRTKQTTAVEGITVAYGFAHELTQAETMDVDSTDYFNGSFVIHWNVMGRNLDYHFGGGYLTLTPYFYRPYPFAPVILKHASSYHYYLRDHLGSNRLVVSGDGTVEQTNEYYPYGGPWGDVSTNQGFQPYKYTGKELDRIHGLDWYDYGARRYDPAYCQFTQIDPLCEQYPHLSPYAYCAGNPVNAIDPDGKKIVFVNGYLALGSPKGGSDYWHGNRSSFVRNAQATFKDYTTPFFTNYDYKYLTSASVLREAQGYQYAKKNYNVLIQDMKPGIDKFNFISHSMGGAFSEGMMAFLAEQGWETENAVFLNAWEPAQIKNKVEKTRFDATCTNDPVQFLSKPVFGESDIPSSDDIIRIESDKSIWFIHRDLIDDNSSYLWKQIKEFLK